MTTPQTVRPAAGAKDHRVVTRERFFGDAMRWRRFGEPTPAGRSLKEDGTPDYGIFGPGSVVWEVLLHPVSMSLQWEAQVRFQMAYRPVAAGIRDRDPISRRAQNGTLTVFDMFERGQRNSGIHAPMWLGDRPTAERTAKHLKNIHNKVAGDVIDTGAPELGGYAANSSRDSLWAVLTEMHSMLWQYEAFAFQGFRRVGRLPDEKRDRFIAEVAEYCRLFDVDEAEIPHSMADLRALYAKYDVMFQYSATQMILPGSGENFMKLAHRAIQANTHPSQWRVKALDFVMDRIYGPAVTGALSPKTRRGMGLSAEQDRKAVRAARRRLPLAWFIQQRPVERFFMRLMWGPDAMMLIEAARELQKTARANA